MPRPEFTLKHRLPNGDEVSVSATVPTPREVKEVLEAVGPTYPFEPPHHGIKRAAEVIHRQMIEN